MDQREAFNSHHRDEEKIGKCERGRLPRISQCFACLKDKQEAQSEYNGSREPWKAKVL